MQNTGSDQVGNADKKPISLDGFVPPDFCEETSWEEKEWMNPSIAEIINLTKMEESRREMRTRLEFLFLQFQKKMCNKIESYDGGIKVECSKK